MKLKLKITNYNNNLFNLTENNNNKLKHSNKKQIKHLHTKYIIISKRMEYKVLCDYDTLSIFKYHEVFICIKYFVHKYFFIFFIRCFIKKISSIKFFLNL
jgi:hypothetical protein